MDGFVTDYIGTFTGEIGRQPTYEEYAQIMTGLHPRTAPGAQRHRPRLRGLRPLVLRGPVPDLHEPVVLDRGHFVGPGGEQSGEEVFTENDAETIFERLEAARQDLEDLRHASPSRSRFTA